MADSPRAQHPLVVRPIWRKNSCKYVVAEVRTVDVWVATWMSYRSTMVINYNMNKIDKSLPEMLNILRIVKLNLKKAKPNTILLVPKGKGKWKPKGKGKTQVKGKGKTHALKPKVGIAKEGTCFHCSETRN